mmetsp:Transcript_11216/g.41085  ORF Transcript_11216/g.41085 Transcript_11216/m.41085 type:complete len:142 (+) Transcript_11216:155-580(+)
MSLFAAVSRNSREVRELLSTPLRYLAVRFATKKGGGVTSNGRDSNPKYLGIKRFGSEYVLAGTIIVRQRGRVYLPGENVGIGKDHTLFAKIDGKVEFKKILKETFKHTRKRTQISVHPAPPTRRFARRLGLSNAAQALNDS